MQTSAECLAELRLNVVCYDETTSFTGECTEPAQTFGFIQPISSNDTDLNCSTNSRTRSLEIRCTF